MDLLCHRQLNIKEGTFYFLYIGELKTLCLSVFLKEALSRRLNRPVDFIGIVPDVMEEYPPGNLMVINPLAQLLSREENHPVSVRLPARPFATAVSEDEGVRQWLSRLLERQGDLPVLMYQSLRELTLTEMPGVRLIGPDPVTADRWNSKLNMYRWLKGRVPLPEFHICRDRDELVRVTRRRWREWNDGIFVSLEYSAAGAFSLVARDAGELEEKIKGWKPPYLVTRFIPHVADPTILGVVANDRDVLIGGVADQQMVNVNQFRGSVYPSSLSVDLQRRLMDYTRVVGRAMGADGYRGIFGCDYIVDSNGEIYFVEVNARKQGTTMEMSCNLENVLPPGSASLIELEYLAVSEGRFPSGIRRVDEFPPRLCWGTYNFKLEEDAVTCRRLPSPGDEREVFRSVAESPEPVARHIIVEHIGKGFRVKSGTFLGRVIAVASDHAGVRRELEKGRRALQQTLVPPGPCAAL